MMPPDPDCPPDHSTLDLVIKRVWQGVAVLGVLNAILELIIWLR